MDFRYTLNSSLGKLVVNDAPKGWDAKKFTLSKSKRYYGNMIAVSASLEFYNAPTLDYSQQGAYDYLDELDELEDSEAVCIILIEALYNSADGWIEEFTGLLRFKDKKQTNQGGKFFSAPIYSDNFSNKLLTRDEISIPYDRLTTLDDNVIIPFDNEYIEVDVLGTESNDITTLKSLKVASGANVNHPSFLSAGLANYWNPTTLTTYIISTEEEVNNAAFFISNDVRGTISGDIVLEVVPVGQIVVTYSIEDYKELDNPIEIYKDSGVVIGDGSGDPVQIILPLGTYTFDEDSRLVVELSIATGDGITGFNETISDLTVISKALPTPCNFVAPFESATRLIESITGQANAVDSEFFGRTDSPTIYDEDGKGSLCFATNGKLARQFPIGYNTDEESKVAQLNFSFNEWFTAMSSIYNIGAGVFYEDGKYKLRIEDRKYFYSSDVIMTITREEMELDSFVRTRDNENYFSKIKSGSIFEQPEEVSGLESYNNVQEYSGVLLNEIELDISTTWIYDPYPMEFARRLPFIGTETTDYKYDSNIMLMVMFRDGSLIQKTDQGYDSITGIDFITTPMNLDITPQRNLRDNWGWLIKTGYKKKNDSVLKYNVSEVVTDLETKQTDSTYTIKENQDINVSDLEAPLYSGNIDSFNAPVNHDIFALLKAGQQGLIKYWNPLKDAYTFGWYNQVSTEPATCATTWEIREAYNFTDSDEAYRLLEDGGIRLLEDGGKRLLE